MTPAAVLRRAAQAFRDGELTWGREWFAQTDDNRCRCAGGAIAFAVDPRNTDADPIHGPDEPAARDLGRAAMDLFADYLVTVVGAPEAISGCTCSKCYEQHERDVIETVGDWSDSCTSVGEVIDGLEAAAAWDEGRVAA